MPGNGAFHLAGIVPVAGQKLDFNMPWHDALMPVGQDYLAVERSVVECAYAGCETIWIVCNDDIEPLIKHRLGDFAQDPICMSRLNFEQRDRKIPIFYVPINPRDRGRRDSLGWSVIHGAMTAKSVSSNISRWTAPNRYYVSFPYGVYPVEFLGSMRKYISSNRGFALAYNGQTIKDGLYLGFTFTAEELRDIKNYIIKEGTGIKEKGHPKIQTKRLPLEKRYSARFFSLDKIFKSVNIEITYEETKDSWILNELLFYYGIDSWENYGKYLGSGDALEIIRPELDIIRCYREFNLVGVDNVQE